MAEVENVTRESYCSTFGLAKLPYPSADQKFAAEQKLMGPF